MRIYVAGPMSNVGAPTYNFPAFETASRLIRFKGHEAVSPHEIDERDGFVWIERGTGGDIIEVSLLPKYTYEGVLARDLAAIESCDAICLIDGWVDSNGANRELIHAVEWGLEVFEGVNAVPTYDILALEDSIRQHRRHVLLARQLNATPSAPDLVVPDVAGRDL